eukprot:TRINITY_DN525_c5_g1_i2.p1 TRINITY_DN525_c5_g1~~TRINITY_DN525_c5_g1_i2.p1  ORF type:complete len:1178 (+),score=473.15 TRINITY_DN525_c5_g1_i2:44-3577(+)
MDHVPQKVSFPQIEADVLEYWEKIDAFQQSLKMSEGKPEFIFNDGPPFATGLPHYGHILAGTIKDTVTRYAHQRGHHVSRRFGWDCHGLPIEFEIDKLLGIKTKQEVLDYGIPNYNKKCREIVMKYSNEWKSVVTRMGRWIDFDNDYKTMDINYMESVWWVFKKLFETKIDDEPMVYNGLKVMPYSPGCSTPLSNFEAGMDYREISDPEVYVKFPLVDDPEVNLIAWTTTPWTLPSNLALCVNPDMDYIKIRDIKTNNIYVVAECRARVKGGIYPPIKKGKKNKKKGKNNNENDKPKDFEVLEKFKGSKMVGWKYTPLFEYFRDFAENNNAFRVVADSYVTDDSGTGVVHQAPGFGEDDFRVCLKEGIIKKGEKIPLPLDPNAQFTNEVPEYEGMFIKDADQPIIKRLKEEGRIVKSGSIVHSYPYCWRSKRPLIYRAIPSWFVRVEKIRDRLVKNNDITHWVPEHVKDGRFLNWISNARDWAISRNRFWGTPLPIWRNPEDEEDIVVIGSVQELEEKSGIKVDDLHRETIDGIKIPSAKHEGQFLERVEEVFDCWFESGSMPYAQLHYPFENKELFEENFPADFIAEGIDQTRGWFYTLMVISTILFDKPAFKNVVVNGLVLAADGRKMSKSLKNYPDPTYVMDSYGADALRMYLINSPVVRAEDLAFREEGVNKVVRDVILPWYHAFRYLSQSILAYEKATGNQFVPELGVATSSKNIMDRYILSAVQSFVKYIIQEMKFYRLYTVLPRLVLFIEELCNWYIKLNRPRLKGIDGVDDQLLAINVLFEVILTMIKAMCPFTPFFTEYLYGVILKIIPEDQRKDSVHFVDFPTPREELIDLEVEAVVKTMQDIINLGRTSRDRRMIPQRIPLTSATVVHSSQEFLDSLRSVTHYIEQELGIQTIKLTTEEGNFISLKAFPDSKVLGKRLRKDMKKVMTAIKALSSDQLRKIVQKGSETIEGHEIKVEELKIIKEFIGDNSQYEGNWNTDVVVILQLECNEELRQKGLYTMVKNRIQRLRKKSGIRVSDNVGVFYRFNNDNNNNNNNNEEFEEIIKQHSKEIEKLIDIPFLSFNSNISDSIINTTITNLDTTIQDVTLDPNPKEFDIELFICRPSYVLCENHGLNLSPEYLQFINLFFVTSDFNTLTSQITNNDNKLNLNFNNEPLSLTLNQHFVKTF